MSKWRLMKAINGNSNVLKRPAEEGRGICGRHNFEKSFQPNQAASSSAIVAAPEAYSRSIAIIRIMGHTRLHS